MTVSYPLCISWLEAQPLGTTAAPQSHNTRRFGWPSELGLQPRPSPTCNQNINTLISSGGTDMKRMTSLFIEIFFFHLGTAGWSPHPCASGLHQSPLVSRQQVILHSLNQVVFTGTAVLNKTLLLHALTQREKEQTSVIQMRLYGTEI